MIKTVVAPGSDRKPKLPTAAKAPVRRNPDRFLAPMRLRPDTTECCSEQRILSGTRTSIRSAGGRSAGAQDAPIAKVEATSRKATLRFAMCLRARLCPDPPGAEQKRRLRKLTVWAEIHASAYLTSQEPIQPNTSGRQVGPIEWTRMFATNPTTAYRAILLNMPFQSCGRG